MSFATQNAWASWLAANHDSSTGVWIAFAKKDSGIPSVTHDQALEIALCHGWIDAQTKGLDEQRWLQRFVPRGPRSKWSKINREKAIALIDRGLMKPSGLREVERAQKDGRWAAAYDPASTATVPEDLQKELDKSATARKFFDGLDSRNRYAILYRIQDAKKPETRAARIARFVAMLKRGEKLHP